jgi:hypothetical protein
MGGTRIPVASGTGSYSPQYGGMPDFTSSSELDRKRRREEERRQDMMANIMRSMMGGWDPNPGNTPTQPRQPGFTDGPIMSDIPGSSYKTRGSAPRYHMEMPYGGTPGVYAIRLDELGGPKEDPWQNMSPHDYIEYQRRSIGRRFRRPGRR